MHLLRTLALSALVALHAGPAEAQTPAAPVRSDPDIPVDALQPDFTLAALPTTLRMPRGKWAFRVTHRFTRPLGEGDFGDLLSDAFGLDGGAQIGLEVRYGLVSGTQIGIHRTSDRTIQLFGQHSALTERDGAPIGLDVLATLEGAENLSEYFRSTLGVIASRNLGRRAAVYAEPAVVVNSSPFTSDDEADNHTFIVGLGARVRLTRSTYLIGEYTPRVAGYDPGDSQISVGFESRAGGHLFQLNVSNGFGTTFGQLSRGSSGSDDWYLGFNISRKFF